MNNLNEMIMEEIGLYPDSLNRIIDEETGGVISVNNKPLRIKMSNGFKQTRDEVYFDLLNNTYLAKCMFQYYMEKVREVDNKFYTSFYDIETPNGICVEVRGVSGVLVSRPYKKESLRYIDLIFQLGGSLYDLNEYDMEV